MCTARCFNRCAVPPHADEAGGRWTSTEQRLRVSGAGHHEGGADLPAHSGLPSPAQIPAVTMITLRRCAAGGFAHRLHPRDLWTVRDVQREQEGKVSSVTGGWEPLAALCRGAMQSAAETINCGEDPRRRLGYSSDGDSLELHRTEFALVLLLHCRGEGIGYEKDLLGQNI